MSSNISPIVLLAHLVTFLFHAEAFITSEERNELTDDGVSSEKLDESNGGLYYLYSYSNQDQGRHLAPSRLESDKNQIEEDKSIHINTVEEFLDTTEPEYQTARNTFIGTTEAPEDLQLKDSKQGRYLQFIHLEYPGYSSSPDKKEAAEATEGMQFKYSNSFSNQGEQLVQSRFESDKNQMEEDESIHIIPVEDFLDNQGNQIVQSWFTSDKNQMKEDSIQNIPVEDKTEHQYQTARNILIGTTEAPEDLQSEERIYEHKPDFKLNLMTDSVAYLHLPGSLSSPAEKQSSKPPQRNLQTYSFSNQGEQPVQSRFKSDKNQMEEYDSIHIIPVEDFLDKTEYEYQAARDSFIETTEAPETQQSEETSYEYKSASLMSDFKNNMMIDSVSYLKLPSSSPAKKQRSKPPQRIFPVEDFVDNIEHEYQTARDASIRTTEAPEDLQLEEGIYKQKSASQMSDSKNEVMTDSVAYMHLPGYSSAAMKQAEKLEDVTGDLKVVEDRRFSKYEILKLVDALKDKNTEELKILDNVCEEKLSVLENKISKLEATSKDMNVEKNFFAEDLERTNQELDEAGKSQNQALSKSNSELTLEIDNFAKGCENIKSDFEGKVFKLEESIRVLNQEKDNRLEAYSNEMNEKNRLAEDLEGTSQELEAAKSQNEALIESKFELTLEVDNFVVDVKRFDDIKSDLEGKVSKLEEINRVLNQEKDDERSNWEKCLQDSKSDSTRLATMSAKLLELQILNTKNEAVEVLNTQVAQDRADIAFDEDWDKIISNQLVRSATIRLKEDEIEPTVNKQLDDQEKVKVDETEPDDEESSWILSTVYDFFGQV